MDRVAFQLGPATVTWYGIFVATGFWLGAWTAARRAGQAGKNPDLVWDLLWVLVAGGIVGARALYVVTYWDRDFRGQPWSEIFMVHHGGLVFHGGFVVATVAGFVWCGWRKVAAWPMADILAPSLALGHAMGRVGCLLNGCCFGRRCEWPWAWHYPSWHETRGAPVHPTQIYEAALGVALSLGLGWWFHRRRFEGEVFALYLIAYGLLRSVVELFRGDYPESALSMGMVTPAHWVSLLLVGVGCGVYGYRCRTRRPGVGVETAPKT